MQSEQTKSDNIPSLKVKRCPSLKVKRCPSLKVKRCPSLKVKRCPSLKVKRCPSLKVKRCPSLFEQRLTFTVHFFGSKPPRWPGVAFETPSLAGGGLRNPLVGRGPPLAIEGVANESLQGGKV
jgi:hypothetical protein